MSHVAVALLLAASTAGFRPDTPFAAVRVAEPSRIPLLIAPAATTRPDSAQKRRVIVEYSDWYGRRLTVHRWSSYTMVPLFAAQYAAGQQLLQKGSSAPAWARQAHGPLATGVATLFTVNTVTGLWNLWDSRQDPAGRGPRIAHSLLMLASDAGFTATGLLADRAESSGNLRQLHKTVALSSMGAALLGYAIMLPPFRRD